MGIYPTHQPAYRHEDTLVTITSTPEGDLYHVFQLTHDIFVRKNCFCCSCEDAGIFPVTRDPFCRNHGWAGTRKCEVHNMPGDDYHDDDDSTRIMTVQEKIRSNESRANNAALRGH